MKQLFFIIAMLSSTAAWCQSQSDYEHVMAKFQKYYNNGSSDSIVNMFSDELGKYKQSAWNDPGNKDSWKEWGKMRGWKYGGVDTEGTQGNPEEGARFFLVTFDKTTHAMSFVLDKKNKFLTFRPMTMSDYINSKLSQYYKGKGLEFYKKNK